MRATKLLMEEHEIILRALDVLEALAGRGERPPAELLEFFGDFADAHHHGKEEEILFPALEEAGFPHDAGPVGVMLHEHTIGRQLLAAIKDPAQSVDAALAYSAMLRAHIEKENKILFPMADRAVEDQQRVDQAFDEFEQQWTQRRARHESAIAQLAMALR